MPRQVNISTIFITTTDYRIAALLLRREMMAFLDQDEVHKAYADATAEADIWRADYPQYERLMDNGLMENMDENLPEVNDGSLAASLFKLAKRVIKKKMSGRAKALDTDDAWITELANIQWENNILKNARKMASPRRKWKDAVRKAAGYGGQPIITLFVENGSYTGADFIVPYAQDVKLEAGKCSDEDSDVIFWDIYYTKLQVKNMIEQAEAEMKEAKETNTEAYNTWDIEKLKEVLEANSDEDRPGNNEHRERLEKGAMKSGIHFYIAYQRGINAPFYMCHKKQVVREWSNPDPTGDVPVHYLYCYQDFINPYGIGIVKLAGGTQNVLDYMRQADILATQLGLRPPKLISGSTDDLDEESMVYAQDANWYAGNARVERMEMSNQVYSQLPERIGMYQTSLQKILPMGDTSISGSNSGDPQVGKTPQALKMADASLSIDDEDFSENVEETWAVVAKSMINTHFANMQGSDLVKLSDEEREIITNAGLPWPVDEATGELIGNELDVLWDEVRATFDFEIDADADKTQDEEAALEGKLRAYEMINADPNIDAYLQMSGKRLDRGELLSDIFSQLTDNDKIIQDISPEEQQQAAAEQDMMAQEPQAESDPALEGEVVDAEQESVNLQAVMEEYNIDEGRAMAMLEAEKQGFSPEEIQEALVRNSQPQSEAIVWAVMIHF